MARKAAQKKEVNNDGKELFEALKLLEAEKGIPVDFMIDKIKKAIATACKNSYGNEDVVIDMDPESGKFDVFLRKEIVEEVENPNREIALEIVKRYDPRAEIGGFVRHRLDTKQFGRVAAQTARNIIRQGIRDSERDQMMQEFKGRHQELVSALVERVDPKTGALSLKIGKAEAILPKGEQVGTENVKEGDHVQVYVVDVKETEKGPKAIISRTHPDLIRRLFEKEVPEIFDGTVEIKAVAREAGSRTKIAVWSNDPDVDPVGACVGMNGARVNAIVNELRGEKIDIINWNENPALLIENALSPAKVIAVLADPEDKTAKVVVPDYQLSLAIGKEGQNARLAARLTGFKIDIKSETQAREIEGWLDVDEEYEEYEDFEEYKESQAYEEAQAAEAAETETEEESQDE